MQLYKQSVHNQNQIFDVHNVLSLYNLIVGEGWIKKVDNLAVQRVCISTHSQANTVIPRLTSDPADEFFG